MIPYAKQVPFIDDAKRVIMGIGYISSIKEPPEHRTEGPGELRSMLWETMLGHTIRDNRENGFLMPYREMMDYAKTHPDFDIRSIIIIVIYMNISLMVLNNSGLLSITISKLFFALVTAS